jgi:hypothetical protein
MAELIDVAIPALGMDTDTTPRLLDKRKAPLIKNFLMHRPGVLPMRGPICEGTTVDFAASIGLMGMWVFDNKLLISRALASATAIRDPWTQLYRPASGNTRAINSTVSVVDLVAGGKTDVVPAGMFPFGRSIRAGNFVYGLASVGVGTIAGNSYTSTRVVRWDGTSIAGGFTLYNAPNAPSDGCQDIAFHYNRIFVFGGIAPGVSVKNAQMNHGLYWTDQLATDASATPLPATLAAWQDDVSGLVNQIIVGSDEPANAPVAMAHVGPSLLLLKRRSLYLLVGNQPANFAIRQVSHETGCLDPRSVVEYDTGAFFMSEHGFMFYDGARLQNMSEGLTTTLLANAVKRCGQNGIDGGFVRAVALDMGYILLTTGVMDGATLTATVDTDAWLFHVPTGTWTQLSSSALPQIVAAIKTIAHTVLLTDQKVHKANFLFTPQNAPAGTAWLRLRRLRCDEVPDPRALDYARAGARVCDYEEQGAACCCRVPLGPRRRRLAG